MTDIEFITEQDETGLGRIVVDGRFYGVPAKAVAIIKFERESLRQQLSDTQRLLAESQAREKMFKHHIQEAFNAVSIGHAEIELNEVLAMPSDSTALDAAIAKAKREVLLEASNEFDKSVWLDACGGFNFARHLRGMADELKGGEQ